MNIYIFINLLYFKVLTKQGNRTWSRIFKSAFQRIVNKIINIGITKLQHLFQKRRSYYSNPMVLIIIKHQLFLTTFNRHSNQVASIILLLYSNEIANLRCAACRMNSFLIELILKVTTVISNTLESTFYHSSQKIKMRNIQFDELTTHS